MISATVAEIAPCQKQLKVEVPLDQVQAEFDAVYGELKKKARVPGFRIGSAPRDLLERYHANTAREEVIKRLVGRSLEEAIASQKGLDLVGQPEVTEVQWSPSTPLTYSAKVEVAPQVAMGTYKGLKLTRTTIQLSEERVEEVLTRLQENQAQLKPSQEKRPAAEGDFLLVDLIERKAGAQPNRRRDLVIQLNLKKDPEGVLAALVGMNPGEKRDVKLTDGSTVTVEFKELKVRELPPLDDAFAKTVGAFESLEKLKESLREDLQKQAEQTQRHTLEWEVSQKLLDGWGFDVPPSLVASQARRILKEKMVEGELLTEQAKMDALKQVKLFFILRRIAQAENISATREEVDARIGNLAQRMGSPVDQVRHDLESKDLLDEIVWGVIRSKVMDLVIQQAEIREKAQK